MRPIYKLSAIFTVILAIAGPVIASGHTTSRDEEAIRKNTRDWVANFKAGDIDGLMKLYMPDARVALHGQPIRIGIGAIRAGFAPGLAAKPDVSFLLDIEEMRIHGDHAFLVSKYWYTSHGGGLPDLADAGRSLVEYQRDRDGMWKILVDIDQATPDVAFPPSATAR
jgi:uncharacterized protein (TIGR02246 family)